MGLAVSDPMRLLIGFLVLLPACPDRPISEIIPTPIGNEQWEIPASVNRDIDILFVIDDSSSMTGEQTSLAQNFPRLMEKLEGIRGGLPNIHIGVVSSDLGDGVENKRFCDSDTGKAGALMSNPSPLAPDCERPQGRFIEDIADPDGQGGRIRNYNNDDGDGLAKTFACIARLGSKGCGLEQHLEAMKRALDGSNRANAGFLRAEAWLAVVFVADEDDCSSTDPLALFGPAEAATVGAKCFTEGVVCAGAVPGAPGTYQGCEARTDSPLMADPAAYAEFLKGLKPDAPDKVIIAGITGPATGSLTVLPGTRGGLDLGKACGDGHELGADTIIRFDRFFKQFPDRSSLASICSPELSDAMAQIGTLLATVVGTHCLPASVSLDYLLDEPGLQPDCAVVENHQRRQDEALPRCPMTYETAPSPERDGPRPCWWAKPDPTCGGSGYSMMVERSGAAPPETSLTISCATVLGGAG